MAITHASGARNAIADLMDDRVNTGAGTAQLRIRQGSTIIVAFNLPNPAFGAAAGGVAALNGTPITAVSIAAGDVDNFQIVNRDGTMELAGSVTASGGGGDLETNNLSINSGQTCTLQSGAYTAPL